MSIRKKALMHHHSVKGMLGLLWWVSMVLLLAGCTSAATPSANLISSTPTAPAPRPSPKPSAPTPCQTQHLLLVLDKSAAAMSNAGAQFSLMNQSKQSCTLYGYPALQLLDARHHPIQAQVGQFTQAYLYNTRPAHRFVLQPGGKAYFMVEWGNLGCGKIPPASFASPVSFLQVAPPLNQASLQVAIQFCAFRNSVELSPLEQDKLLP